MVCPPFSHSKLRGRCQPRVTGKLVVFGGPVGLRVSRAGAACLYSGDRVIYGPAFFGKLLEPFQGVLRGL